MRTYNFMTEEESIETLPGQECPMCKEKTLTLTEMEKEIPYFGKIFLFSMNCSNCKYHKADVEAAQPNDPTKYEFEITCEDDMKVRVVKGADATVKIPRIVTISPGAASNGYVTNIEGIFNRVKTQLEKTRDTEEDKDARKKVKNMLKKVQNIMWGREKIKITLEDPSGNSAIISDKAVKTKLKVKK